MDMLADFHFLRPLWLLCLLPAVLLARTLWRINENSSAWDRAIDRSLLPYLLDRRKSASQRTPLILLLLAWSAAIIALAGPVWDRIPQPVQKRQDALVIIMDLSLSMFATDLDPNRITVARRKLLDVLALRPEGQTGLVVYAGDAHTVTPLTDDSVTIAALAPSLSPNIMPAFGSNPAAGIERALAMMGDAGASSGQLLLITDGIEATDVTAIQQLLQGTPYSLSILGIGTRQGAPIPVSGSDFLRDTSGNVVIPAFDSGPLETLASRLNGRYTGAVLSASDLEYLLADFSFRDDENLADTGENFDIWYDAGPWLLLLVLPLSALIFRRGWVLTVVMSSGAVMTLMLPAAPAEAFEWRDLWKTKNQQAAEAFAQEDVATAQQLFQTPEWKGTAAYRSGDYDAAIQAFAQGTDVASYYNLGNALAHARRFEEAIQAYDAALALQPDHRDALHNRQIVEDLLEEQQEEEERQNAEQEQEQDQQQEQESAQSEPSQNDSNPQEQEPQDPSEEENPEQQDAEESESDPQEQQNQEPQQNNSSESLEDQESLEQWLRRIEDDPGELLQRKFQFEYRRRQMENRAAGNRPTDRQIW